MSGFTYKELRDGDRKRYGGKFPFYEGRLLFWLRKGHTSKGLWQKVCKLFLRFYCGINNNGISCRTEIGPGLYLGHTSGININFNAVIGKNCNIHKGVTIGQEARGQRKGTPVIGDRVWIGVNAVVVGRITIGDDVLIAPNSFVNCDVPAHSIVLGNPCVIKPRDNATEEYITNLC